jgi:hypothetical protein
VSEIVVRPAAIAGESEAACLLALATHSWRLSRLCRRAADKLSTDEAGRLTSQLRYTERQIQEDLDKVGIKVLDLDGQTFEAGTPATAINAADFSPDTRVRVAQTLEPVITGRTGLLQFGVVVLEIDS